MKKYIILILALLIVRAGGASEVYEINRGWKFFSASHGSGDNAAVINLPHTWNSDALGSSRDYIREVGNYLKQINIPSAWNGRRVYLRLGAANSLCDVMVNGRHAGQHRGGYTAFTLDITDYLRFGELNSLWVIVNNSTQPDILPTAGDQNSYGGLIRGVELIVANPISVALTDYASGGVYVTSHKTANGGFTMETTVKIASKIDRSVQVSVALTDHTGKQVGREEDKVKASAKNLVSLTIPMSVASPRLWDGVNDPYLYNVCVKVMDDQKVCDSVVVQTGFRDFGFDKTKGFLLNGKPYKLHGVTLTQDRAIVGTALQPYHVDEDLALVGEMGVNMVHVKGFAHHPRFYELCDRAGIMVWNDTPFIGASYLTDVAYFNTQAFRKNGRDQLTETIRQLYNHPSVVAWGIFNCISQKGDNPLDYVKELNALAKKEDPTRYTVATSNEDGQINFVTDLISWKHNFGWTEGAPGDIAIWLKYLHSTWGNLSSSVSYGAGGSIDDQCDSLYRPVPNSNFHPERWQTHLHQEYFKHLNSDSLLWGAFVCNMFDYGAAVRSTVGDGTGINDFGLVSFDRKYCKDAFYFYKANWNSADPFVYLAERRWSIRAKTVQAFKVFSNCAQVELVVNGVSQGAVQGVNGTFLWPQVTLRKGGNTVEARFGELSDRMRITIEPTALD